DARIPALGKLGPQRRIAVVAVKLVQGGRLEALAEARAQNRPAVVQDPGGGELAVLVPAVHAVVVVALAGGEREPRGDLRLQLRVARVDGRRVHERRRHRRELRGEGVDGGTLVLRAEHGLHPGRQLPRALVLFALVGADAVEGLGGRAAVVGRRIRIVVAAIRVRVLERDAVGERAVGRVQREAGVTQYLVVHAVLVVVAEVARGRVEAVEVGARLRVVAAQVELQIRCELIAQQAGAAADLARAQTRSAELLVECGNAAGAVPESGHAPHPILALSAHVAGDIARVVGPAFGGDAAAQGAGRLGGHNVDHTAHRLAAVQGRLRPTQDLDARD